MLCLTGSPPLTVLSVITYLASGSGSNKTPSKTSSTTARSPLAPVPRCKAIRAISLTAPSVNVKSAAWQRKSLLLIARFAYSATRVQRQLDQMYCYGFILPQTLTFTMLVSLGSGGAILWKSWHHPFLFCNL